MKKINANIILGCGGSHFNQDFVFCEGTYNNLLNLKDIDNFKYNKVILFLDKASGLFDNPIYDYNKIFNTLNLIQKKYEIFNEEQIINIQHYLRIHKQCSLFLGLKLEEENE